MHRLPDAREHSRCARMNRPARFNFNKPLNRWRSRDRGRETVYKRQSAASPIEKPETSAIWARQRLACVPGPALGWMGERENGCSRLSDGIRGSTEISGENCPRRTHPRYRQVLRYFCAGDRLTSVAIGEGSIVLGGMVVDRRSHGAVACPRSSVIAAHESSKSQGSSARRRCDSLGAIRSRRAFMPDGGSPWPQTSNEA